MDRPGGHVFGGRVSGGVVVGLLFVLAMALSPAPASAQPWLGTLITDSVASWWARPTSVYQPTHDITYVSGVSSSGDWVWGAYDEKSGVTIRRVLGRHREDDHNTPAIIAPPDRPPVVFYTGHNLTNVIWYRVSRAVGDWYPGTERALEMPGPVTYVQAHIGRTPDTILLFTRCIDRWLICISEDYGKTWAIRPLLQFPKNSYAYLITAGLEDGTIRGAVAGHPDKSDLASVWYFEIDPLGAIHAGPGTIETNVYTGQGLPVRAPDDLTVAYRYPDGMRARLFDVSTAPDPEIAIAQWRGSAEAKYVYLRLEEAGWSSRTVVAAGRPIGYLYPIRYLGGMSFPNPTQGGVFYSARETDSEWRLERWTGSGGAWASELVATSEQTLARPSPPIGASEHLPLMWLKLTRYDDYENYAGSTQALLSHGRPRSAGTGVPVAGDWDGDGKSEPALFSNGMWKVRVKGKTVAYRFGRAGDVPIAGDWDGDGADEPGVFRFGRWILATDARVPNTLRSFSYGRAGDAPIVGDWDGDGVDGIGLRRGVSWLLRRTPTAGKPFSSFAFGRTTDRPLAGDWDGDGIDGIAVRRDTGWLVRQAADPSSPGSFYTFGRSSDVPVIGDWTGEGIDAPAVRRPASGIWYTVVTPSSLPTRAYSPDRFIF